MTDDDLNEAAGVLHERFAPDHEDHWGALAEPNGPEGER